jgi:hypothetical protein
MARRQFPREEMIFHSLFPFFLADRIYQGSDDKQTVLSSSAIMGLKDSVLRWKIKIKAANPLQFKAGFPFFSLGVRWFNFLYGRKLG